LGDLNAKSTSLCCTTNNTNGEILENILLDHNNICVNNNNHTYYSFNNISSDILDYVIIASTLDGIKNALDAIKSVKCLIIFYSVVLMIILIRF
jgi:hypothetical protein